MAQGLALAAVGAVNGRLGRYRRVLAAVFAAGGAGFALLALRPGMPAGVQVPVAARDMPGGAALGPGDTRMVRVPSGVVPDGVLRGGVTGRVLAGPMRRGEPVTDVRLMSGGLLHGHGQGAVAAPVRIADGDAVRLLRPGDRIDVLAAAPPADELAGPRPFPAGAARVVASSVPVIAVPRPEGTGQGALVVLATDRGQAAALAGASAPLSVAITGP